MWTTCLLVVPDLAAGRLRVRLSQCQMVGPSCAGRPASPFAGGCIELPDCSRPIVEAAHRAGPNLSDLLFAHQFTRPAICGASRQRAIATALVLFIPAKVLSLPLVCSVKRRFATGAFELSRNF